MHKLVIKTHFSFYELFGWLYVTYCVCFCAGELCFSLNLDVFLICIFTSFVKTEKKQEVLFSVYMKRKTYAQCHCYFVILMLNCTHTYVHTLVSRKCHANFMNIYHDCTLLIAFSIGVFSKENNE